MGADSIANNLHFHLLRHNQAEDTAIGCFQCFDGLVCTTSCDGQTFGNGFDCLQVKAVGLALGLGENGRQLRIGIK